ncbi:hypothetical protein [Salmonella enterica]|uniref:hypothetical protein n=1 Tax=Salmonella enterica TaxID=28901 RepID=UPI001E3B1619|nr:hypothetical protein [Salmonella enterica]
MIARRIQLGIERRLDDQLRQHMGKLVKISFGFKAISQFSRQCFEFLFAHNYLSPLLE